MHNFDESYDYSLILCVGLIELLSLVCYVPSYYLACYVSRCQNDIRPMSKKLGKIIQGIQEIFPSSDSQVAFIPISCKQKEELEEHTNTNGHYDDLYDGKEAYVLQAQALLVDAYRFYVYGCYERAQESYNNSVDLYERRREGVFRYAHLPKQKAVEAKFEQQLEQAEQSILRDSFSPVSVMSI